MAHTSEFLKLVDESRTKIQECDIHAVKKKMDENAAFILVDTREDREWVAGRIKGAVHIGKGVIERDIEGKIPDKDVEIILYCGGGFRSALAAEAIQKMGYKNVISMDGGIRAWREAGYPQEEGQ